MSQRGRENKCLTLAQTPPSAIKTSNSFALILLLKHTLFSLPIIALLIKTWRSFFYIILISKYFEIKSKTDNKFLFRGKNCSEQISSLNLKCNLSDIKKRKGWKKFLKLFILFLISKPDFLSQINQFQFVKCESNPPRGKFAWPWPRRETITSCLKNCPLRKINTAAIKKRSIIRGKCAAFVESDLFCIFITRFSSKKSLLKKYD